jgi:hypothetical protein
MPPRLTRSPRAAWASRTGPKAPQVADVLAIAGGGYRSGDAARVAGCTITDMAAGDQAAAQLRAELTKRGLRLAGAIPHRPELTWPGMLDLVRELRPRVLHAGDLSRRIRDIAVFAQGVPGGLRVLTDGRMIVIPDSSALSPGSRSRAHAAVS